jgi:membrane-associated protein
MKRSAKLARRRGGNEILASARRPCGPVRRPCRQIVSLNKLAHRPPTAHKRTAHPMIDAVKHLIDFILHIDVHLREIVAHYGTWTYAVLALIIFAETGLVVTPFLPGDSLLFAAGALSAAEGSQLNVHVMALLLFTCAVLGDSVNYWIGSRIGPAVFKREDSIFLRKKHLERAHAFFEKYGGRAIILARFVPIVRTFVPFVAGIGSMSYKQFMAFNVVGGFAWVYLFTYAGFFFGGLETVRKNFHYVILGIIFVSILPIVFEFARAWLASRKEKSAAS